MVTDPVCGMKVDEKSAAARADYQRAVFEGKAYYFCSEQCKAEFERQPERYVALPVKSLSH
jgi:YHS domain-containing protein